MNLNCLLLLSELRTIVTCLNRSIREEQTAPIEAMSGVAKLDWVVDGRRSVEAN